MKRLIVLMLMAMPLLATAQRSDAEALIQYTQRYPAAQPQDMYKMIFQDIYGPGHIIRDSASCAAYIEREAAEMADSSAFPLWEYTLCDSAFVRVNLAIVKRGWLSVGKMTSLVVRSAAGLPQPENRFHMSHSSEFKAAYDPHYRIVRRDLFEHELLPLLRSK